MLLRRLLRSSSLGSTVSNHSRRLGGLSALAGALMLSACATQPQTASTRTGHVQLAQIGGAQSTGTAESPALDDGSDFSTHDPLEKVNRGIFAFDMTLDRYALRPVAKAYRDTVPAVARTAMTNVLHNLQTPIIMANDLLQGNMPRFGQSFARIWMNTILGLGGFIDVAGQAGIPFHDSDFGQTMGVWGVGPGPYLVLPVLGPSDPRDAQGFGVDSVGDPWGYEMRMAHIGLENTIAHTGATVINDRSHTIDELDELQRNSLDFYATIRSLYQQKRAGDVQAGKTIVVPPAPKTASVPYDKAAPNQIARVPAPFKLPASALPQQQSSLDLSLPIDAIKPAAAPLHLAPFDGAS